MEKLKLRLYFEGGHKIDIKCESYEFNSQDGEIISWKVNGVNKQFGFSLSKLVAWERLY